MDDAATYRPHCEALLRDHDCAAVAAMLRAKRVMVTVDDVRLVRQAMVKRGELHGYNARSLVSKAERAWPAMARDGSERLAAATWALFYRLADERGVSVGEVAAAMHRGEMIMARAA